MKSAHLLTALCLTLSTGCSSLDLLNKPEFVTAGAQNPAVRCLTLWQAAEGQGLDGQTTRGFAGRIYFFTSGSPLPVAVDGDVRIFEFDDVGEVNEQTKPIHQFDFLDGSWNAHLYDSQLGPVYQVFIPYTREGLNEAECSLRVRLTRPDETKLFSQITPIELDGLARADKPKKEPEQVLSVRLVDSQGDESDTIDDPPKRGLHITTIGTREDGHYASVPDRIQHVGRRMPAPKQQTQEDRISELEQRLAEFHAERRAAESQPQPTQRFAKRDDTGVFHDSNLLPAAFEQESGTDAASIFTAE